MQKLPAGTCPTFSGTILTVCQSIMITNSKKDLNVRILNILVHTVYLHLPESIQLLAE